MAQAKQRSTGSTERPSLDGFPSDLSGTGKDDLLDLSRRFGVDFIRLQFTDILGINKNVEMPRSQFEKALDGEIMFDGSSIEGFVRIEESDMLLKPDLATFRDPARATTKAGGWRGCSATSTRPTRQPFVGCPRDHAQASARARDEAGLRDDGRAARPSSSCSSRRPTAAPTTATHDVGVLLRPRARSTRARRSGASSSSSSSRWASRSRRRTTRWRTGSTRSTSATPMRSSRPTTSRPSSSSSGTSPTATATSRRSCPSRSRASTAAACTRISRCSAGKENAFYDPKAEYQLSKTALQLHRGAAAARARLLRDHQPARQQLQAAGARLRGAVERGVVHAEPLAAGADSRPARPRHALRAADAGPVVQSVPRAHRAARGRARRRRAQARPPASRYTATSSR